MKFNDTLMNLIDADIESGLIPMLLGEPGIGKSSWVASLAQRHGTQVFVLPCNQLADKADLTGGRLVPIEGTNDYKMVFYPHSVIMDAIMYAETHPHENPILFMDELNRTTPDVTSECLSIPTLRAIGNKTLPKNLRVITAGNDKGNITSLDEASISRFVLYHVAPDVDTFLGLDPNLNVFVRQVLIEHPDTIFCKKVRLAASAAGANGSAGANGTTGQDDDGVDIDSIVDDAEEMNQIATPRTISGVSAWLNCFDNQQLKDLLMETRVIDGVTVSALKEALEGHTGATAFTDCLLNEIASKINTASNSTKLRITKPKCYDQMKNCKDMAALQSFVSGMSNSDRSNCLIYALHESQDNEVYIQVLAPLVNQPDPAASKMLLSMLNSGDIDEDNKTALSRIQCEFTQKIAMFL